jgi:hypothetical protein
MLHFNYNRKEAERQSEVIHIQNGKSNYKNPMFHDKIWRLNLISIKLQALTSSMTT